MKIIQYVLFIFVFSVSILYAQDDVISELKRIDSSMCQGTIKYIELLKSDQNNYSREEIICYSSNGKCKKKVINFKPYYVIDQYYDGSSYFSLDHNTNVLNFDDDFNSLKSNSILGELINSPSIYYGRGLSLLSDLKYNSTTNEIIGSFNGDKIVAKIDKKYNYAAYEIKVYANDKLVATCNNDNPILVDNKFYVYSNSTLKMNVFNFEKNIKITSITSNEPNKKDYQFDNDFSDYITVDMRVGRETPVTFSLGKLPKNLTSSQLFELSKRKAKEDANFLKKANTQFNSGGQKNFKLLIVSVFIITIILLIGLIKNKNS